MLTVVADVRDLAAMQAAADQAVEKFGGIDIVVANAGIASYGSVLKVDPEAFKRVLDVNLLGVFHTVRAALPSVIDRRGYVLIVSSLAAFTAAPGMAPYDMSKAGNEHLANALRLEVAHLGVAVGSAHMSWIDTALVRDTKADLPSFREQLAKFPWPLSKTTSVEKCGAAFVAGIEGRKKRVYCPSWVGLFRWLKPILSTRFGESRPRATAASCPGWTPKSPHWAGPPAPDNSWRSGSARSRAGGGAGSARTRRPARRRRSCPAPRSCRPRHHRVAPMTARTRRFRRPRRPSL